MEETKMKLTTIYLPEDSLQQLDDLVKKGFFPHRAEAIRYAIKLLIEEHKSFIRGT